MPGLQGSVGRADEDGDGALRGAPGQAAAFYRQVARNGCVWTLRDAGGFPAPMSTGGHRAQPFWSTSFRVLRMIRTVPAFRDFMPVRLSWEEFRDQWLPGLDSSGLLVGINWDGPRAVGYDLEPQQVVALVERAMGNNGERRPRARRSAGELAPGASEEEARRAEGLG